MSPARWVVGAPAADAAVQQRLESLGERLSAALHDDLLALVVGGSLARGEGVVLQDAAGPRLLSDIDLYAVVRPSSLARAADALAAARAAFADDPFLLAPLDLGAVEPSGFGRLGATLPAYQLAAAHRVLWERDAAWDRPQPPPGGPAALDPGDALRLLHNRLAEHLLIEAGAHGAAPAPFARFHRWKVWLDAPLAWLASEGRYAPTREEQLAALEAQLAALPAPAAHWLREGIAVARSMVQAMRSGPLSESWLRKLPAAAPPAEARDVLIAWIWPFYRATLSRVLEPRVGDGAQRLAAGFAEGLPHAADAVRARRWLRRVPLPSRLREARRWAPLAPRPLTPWWWHGKGGCGAERMYAASALRFARLPQWELPLRGLLRAEGARGVARAGAGEWSSEAPDALLGALWSGWITGGARR